MSFNIDWETIKQNGLCNTTIKKKLNTYLKDNGSSILPKYINNASIELIDIGDVSPELSLKNISDPISSIYDSIKTDLIEEWNLKNGMLNTYMETDFNLTPNKLDSQLIVDLKYTGNFQMVMKADLSVNYPSENFITLPLKLHISDLKIHSLILVAYLHNIQLKITEKKRQKQSNRNKTSSESDFTKEKENNLNKDDQNSETPNNKTIFTILCDVKDDTIESDTIVTNLSQMKNTSNISLNTETQNINENNNYSANNHINNNQTERSYFIRNISIKTEIGEGILPGSDKSILRNIQDLELMIVELLRKFIRDEICYPNWIEFDI
ncbi:hypothetical protein QEN19_000300 [Hanseniaspora menglaensis]